MILKKSNYNIGYITYNISEGNEKREIAQEDIGKLENGNAKPLLRTPGDWRTEWA